MQLIVDNRVGVFNQEIKISSVDQGEAQSWLNKLDGCQHTLLCFERQDGWQLMVGGGPAHYVITLENGSDNLTFRAFNDDEGKVFEICAGGQFGEFPKKICATYQQATHVINLFFNRNEKQENWI